MTSPKKSTARSTRQSTLASKSAGDGGVSPAPVPGFPIVGLGASAGGLGAFEQFFSGMPPDVESGMAFVLVQHLAPDHKSLLAELVRRYTRMRVLEVEDGMEPEPDTTYIIPPNRDMELREGKLRLLEPASPRGQRLPIDFFFRSLAEGRAEQAICIVLSGTGSDGALGVRAIKGAGGMAMAQEAASCEYDGKNTEGLIRIRPEGLIPFAIFASRAYRRRGRRTASSGDLTDRAASSSRRRESGATLPRRRNH